MLMHIAPLLALTPEIKQELYPILLFLGMFAVVFGLGGTTANTLVRRLPRKPGSMLDEILSEKWEDEQEDERENADEQHTQEKE